MTNAPTLVPTGSALLSHVSTVPASIKIELPINPDLTAIPPSQLLLGLVGLVAVSLLVLWW